MSTSTPATLFNDSVANLARTSIIEPLVNWLKTSKNVEVTAEEVLEALNIPINVTPRFQSSYNQSIPNSLKGAVASKPRTSKKADPNAAPCEYVFLRGDRKGQACGAPAIPGTRLCKTCDRKTSAARYKQDAPQAVRPQTRTPNPRADTEPYGDDPNKFIDKEDGFILDRQSDNSLVVTAVLDGDQERELNEEEKGKAQNKGFCFPIKTTPVQAIPTTKSVIPSFNQMSKPGIFSKPSLPKFGGSNTIN